MMLLIFIAVHLLSTNSSTAPLSHPLDIRDATDTCDDINNCRTLFSIVWSCLATIFACTWVSVHPNVPPPDQSRLHLLWRRLMMMLIGIMGPEIMVGFAARQLFASRSLSKRESTVLLPDVSSCSIEFGFSETHSFFCCMGGFVSSDGHPIATRDQLENRLFGSEFQKAIRDVNKEDIMDKSKGDALSKGVALLQLLWFTIQCLARVHQHLAVTQLEVATLAFAVLDIFVWLLWWNKPLDVQRPMVLEPRMQPDAQAFPAQLSRLEHIWAAIFGFSANQYPPLSSVSVPSFWSMGSTEFDVGAYFLLALVGTVFGIIHSAAWNTVFPTPAEMWIWRTSSLVITTMPGLASLLTLMVMAELKSVSEPMLRILMEPLLGILMAAGSPIYIAVRVILIVLPLIGLRSLPPSAFVDVSWSTYIPHI
ncbi:hypothetical protein MSAN_00635000 [Mycena sanguinolenta]|uniref:Uncharacterized protein n=1 Tax=Mycena sanguinolenta TaxID=230812 RepID=A0A8H6YZS5_9AGAR|nr:hypothetical protein MSAN_00635000 [Mycena sanguinolenta]